MRLSLLLIITCTLSLSATTTYSQQTKLSLSLKNASLQDLLQEIGKKSDFSFWYSNNELNANSKITLAMKDQTIDKILDIALKDQGLAYEINDKIIVIYKPKDAIELARQQQKLSGRVTDASTGEVIIGANIIIEGTTRGTVTDVEGKFSIDIAAPNEVILFSFLGYNTERITYAGETNIEIKLVPDITKLEEVVVVGYGIQKKVNVIGSIAQISSEQLEGRQVPLLSNALAGQMTGVTVIQRSGAPGSSSGTISVRGVGSFGAAPDALVLIDGIPGSINDVRSDEVESISVLKDAASAAIYGARAANGVILITTKAGKASKVKVNYMGYGGFVSPTALPELVNSWDYAKAYNEASGSTTYTEDDIQKFKDGTDPDNYPNSNMLEDIVNRMGFQTGHDLTFNGGNEINKYYLSVGYLSQDGVVEKNNFTRYSARLNMISALTPRLKLTTRISGINSKIDEPASPASTSASRLTDMIRTAAKYPPTYATILQNGDFGRGNTSTGTPVAGLKSPSFYNSNSWKYSSNINLEYKPIKDLTLSAIGGLNYSNGETKLYSSTLRLDNELTVGPSNMTHEFGRTIYQTLQSTVNYNKNLGKNAFNILLGYSFEKQKYREISGFRDNFPGNDLPYLDAGSPENQTTGSGGYDWAIESLFGRITYNFDEKYLFETTIRNDGSSRFPKTMKYAIFPSLAIGWRISNENFIKNNIDWINNLKIKASWGKLGNQNIGNYPWQTTYSIGSDQSYVFGGSIVQGGVITSLRDPNLHWETTNTSDIGFESSFFSGKLNLNASYFYRKTYDILYRPTSSISTVLGMGVSETNTGSLKNTGLEFEMGYKNIIGDFKYSINGNFTIINNEVLDLGVGNVEQLNGLVGNGSDLFIGNPMQLYYGLQTDGVFLDQADIDSWYAINDQTSILPKTNAKPGDFRYVDLSGDGKVDLSYDRKVLGSQIPQYNFSANIGLEYKRFDLGVMLQGVSGVNGMLSEHAGLAFYNLGTLQEWMWKGRFNPERPTRYPEYPRLEVLENTTTANTIISDFWVLDASYLRVKNVQIGYSFPEGLMNKIRVDALRIYASAENPYTFSHYRKGWDPEINSKGDFYPILATYTIGLNLKF